MTLAEWYAAYLLRFGSETLLVVTSQEGELEFLRMMATDLHTDREAKADSAWILLKDHHLRQLRREARAKDIHARPDQTV